MKIVKFVRNYHGYGAGDGAAFEDDAAAQALIDSGYAEEQKQDDGPKPKAKSATKPLDDLVEK
jgi:hypothetical protein